MIKHEVYCDTCGDRVMGTDRKVLVPFVPYEFDRTTRPFSFRIADTDKSARHACKDCLASFAELHKLTKTVGFVSP